MRAFKVMGVLAAFLISFGVMYRWMHSPDWVFQAGYLTGLAICIIPILALVYFACAPVITVLLQVSGFEGRGIPFTMLLKLLAVLAFFSWVVYRMVS